MTVYTVNKVNMLFYFVKEERGRYSEEEFVPMSSQFCRHICAIAELWRTREGSWLFLQRIMTAAGTRRMEALLKKKASYGRYYRYPERMREGSSTLGVPSFCRSPKLNLHIAA
jgi:hypothetical protein